MIGDDVSGGKTVEDTGVEKARHAAVITVLETVLQIIDVMPVRAKSLRFLKFQKIGYVTCFCVHVDYLYMYKL